MRMMESLVSCCAAFNTDSAEGIAYPRGSPLTLRLDAADAAAALVGELQERLVKSDQDRSQARILKHFFLS